MTGTSRSTDGAIRRLVILQLAILCVLVVLATLAATLIVLRYDRVPEQQPHPPGNDPLLGEVPIPIPDSGNAIVIAPAAGETGPLRMPDGTLIGDESGAGWMMIPGPDEPATPALSAAEVQQRVRSVFPWRVELGGRATPRLYLRAGRLFAVHVTEDRVEQLSEVSDRGEVLWTMALPQGLRDVQVAAGTAVFATRSGFQGVKDGRVSWSRDLQSGDEPIGLATADGVVYAAYNELDHRPPPKDAAEARARRGEAEWQPGRLAALDPRSGAERWVAQIPAQVADAPVPTGNGSVLLPLKPSRQHPPLQLAAFSASGKQLWSYGEEELINGFYSPVIGPDGACYVVPRRGDSERDLLRFERNGKLGWRRELAVCFEGDMTRERFAPQFHRGDILFTARPGYTGGKYDDDRYIMRLDMRSGAERWRYLLGNSNLQAPLLVSPDGIVYAFAHAEVHALNSQGMQLWQSRVDVVGGELQLQGETLLVAGNMIQGLDRNGRVIEQLRLYLPSGPGRHESNGKRMYYTNGRGIQAVTP